ncbi:MULTISPECIES: anthranilate phosphoribosyltransferase [Corynebacterium]|uniref:anthranilate phosphoribosyltransferase n=1 Tax=Corynebacterium TaxID=1716 RepID=UPI00195E4492|nr:MULTISPECIES: anthranilate phosphoribosyltransferase [Corynebacterium]MDN8625096.1 anthranilate phosphoribosyltransferase [Corynebacterium kroppenstedtii]QRQ64849.1 anthranilate phosphoribosyltransferase [Corynebacterium kroppenstedtii]
MTTNWVDLLNHIADGRDLTADEVSAAMHSIMSGEASPAKIASFIYGIRVKGITPTELEAAASTMLDFAEPITLPPSLNEAHCPAVDIVGTGGDGAHTVNVSTMAALLIASMGIDVIKHGNRAASSRSGGADMLEALGVPIDLSPANVTSMVSQHHFAFIFARTYHPAMKYAAPVRSDIKVPTLFNLLGPMTNPAQPTAGLIGCAFPDMTSVMANAFARRGDTVLVVHGHDGLDEFSVSGPTDVYVTHDGGVERSEFDPRDYGFAYHPVSAIRGGDADTNARVARQLFSLDPTTADRPTTPLPCDMDAVENAVLFSAAGALVSVHGHGKESFHDAMGNALNRAKVALHDEGTTERIRRLISGEHLS